MSGVLLIIVVRMISVTLARYMQQLLANKRLSNEDKAQMWAAFEIRYTMDAILTGNQTIKLQRNVAQLLVDIHTNRAYELDKSILMWGAIESYARE